MQLRANTGQLKGRRPLGRSKRISNGNVRMDVKEIGVIAKNWADSAQDRDYWRGLVNAKLNLRVP